LTGTRVYLIFSRALDTHGAAPARSQARCKPVIGISAIGVGIHKMLAHL
jgi:hypothetical protein